MFYHNQYLSGPQKQRRSLRDIDVFFLRNDAYVNFTKSSSIGKIQEYKSFRHVFSASDVAAEIILTRLIADELGMWLPDIGSSEESRKVSDFVSKLSEADSAELTNTIYPMSQDPRLITVVSNFLKPSQYEKESTSLCEVEMMQFSQRTETDKTKVPYRVVTFGTSLYILVEEGFLDHLSEKTARKIFFTVVLKAAYSIMTINDVNASEWFRQYLKTLKESV